MLSIRCSGFVATQIISGSSGGMQKGGRSWSETLRLGSRRVAHLRAKCAALCFCRTGLTGLCTGLTDVRVGITCRPVWPVGGTGLTGWAEAAHSCSCRSFFLWNLVISTVKFVNHVIYVYYVSYCVFELDLWKLLYPSLSPCYIFKYIYRACTICVHPHVGLPVLFRSGRGLRKDRQIKPLS